MISKDKLTDKMMIICSQESCKRFGRGTPQMAAGVTGDKQSSR